MGYRVVFCDIDGTLLNNDHRMLESTLASIKELQSNGIPFVLVTARGPSGVYPIFRRYEIVCPIVCYSGSLAIDSDGTVLWEKGFSKSIAAGILSYIEENKYDCTWNIYSLNSWIVNDRNDVRVKREEAIVEADSSQGNISLLSDDEKIGKLLCMCNPNETSKIEEGLRAKYPSLSIMRSSDILVEIMDKGISKSNGVELFCQHLGVDIKDAVAFGDHYNDLDMLQSVGMPFLMKNAPDELKELVNNVTLSNEEDGIYQGLKRIGLVK